MWLVTRHYQAGHDTKQIEYVEVNADLSEAEAFGL